LSIYDGNKKRRLPSCLRYSCCSLLRAVSFGLPWLGC
jgi:hypothetical protein